MIALLATPSRLGSDVCALRPTVFPPEPTATSSYDAFGFVGLLPSGSLIDVHRSAPCHVCADGFGVIKARWLRLGTDGWTPETVIATPDAGVDLHDLGGGVTPTGRVVVFYGRYDQDAIPVGLSLNYIFSDDEGVTWSAQQELDHGDAIGHHPYGGMISIGSGKLLQGWYRTDALEPAMLYVTTSSDNGSTWSAPVVVISGPDTTPGNAYTEASYVYLGSDTILGVTRNNLYGTQMVSTDNGATWTSQGDLSQSIEPYILIAPWLTTYTDADSDPAVLMTWTSRSRVQLYAVSGKAASLVASGPSAWILGTRVPVRNFETPMDSGYGSQVPYARCSPVASGMVGWLGVASEQLSTSVAQMTTWCYSVAGSYP